MNSTKPIVRQKILFKLSGSLKKKKIVISEKDL